MPDILKQTISATQAPALFGVSPYYSLWMIKRWFIHNDPIENSHHNRLDWGTRLEPLILEQAAEDLHLEVRSNRQADGTQQYVRRGLLGCTRDAEIICPDRGPGALECKSVFDFRSWMENWNGGGAPPRHIEIQTQVQLMVGDGTVPYTWGVIAVWCCGEMHYFERKPIISLWEAMKTEAEAFFDDVAARREGDPFGEPVEWPLLAKLYPPIIGTTIDLTAHPKAQHLADQAAMMKWHAQERLGHAKGAEAIKVELKAAMGEAEEATLLDGVKVRQKLVKRRAYDVKASSYTTLDVFVPGEAPEMAAPDTTIISGG